MNFFSKKPNYHLETNASIIPIHINDDISSLSAVLLNDDFYDFMLQGRKTINGLSVLSAEYLIPFKMYAWLNLKNKKENGFFVKNTDLKKHKYDVFRLLRIVSLNKVINLQGLVFLKTNEFIELMKSEDLPLDKIGISFSASEGIDLLKRLYGLM